MTRTSRSSQLFSGISLVLLAGILPAAAADPAFSDKTVQVGINVLFDANGYDHWQYTGGGAVGDYNRDGFQDVFILDGDGRDHLYINNGNGTFSDQAVAWGLTVVHKGKGASVGDYDRDGWPDIYVTSAGATGTLGPCKHKLYHNNGNGTFSDVAAAAGVQCTTTTVQDGFGSTFGDYDLDGDLDLFVGGFGTNNSGSKLFRNNGNGTFTNVTATINLFGSTPPMSHFAPRLVDMNGDDYPELLMVSDFGTSHYFRNNANGTFTDITASTGACLEENGMGQTIGDFNRDGIIDWYATSIYLPSSGWTGNKLYINGGNHHYSEISVPANVYKGGYGWGALAVDFNHDAWLDILETNGDSSGSGTFFNEPSYLWMNNGNNTFTEKAIASGLVHLGKGRGIANLDFDNDGDEDVVIFANNESVMFYRNDLSGPSTNWLRVVLNTLSTPSVAPDGYGARVFATNSLINQVRYITTGDAFLSHSEATAHFGLGAATLVDQLKVHWPDGVESTIAGVEVNRTVTLVAHHGSCTPFTPAASGLMLGKSGGNLTFHWTDAGSPDDYVVLADSAPAGHFALLTGTAPNGATGVQIPMPVANRYFLVSGRADNCIGP